MKIHLDTLSGISGDMFLAACLDLGLDQTALVEALQRLDLPPWTLQVERGRRGGLAGCSLNFEYAPEKKHRHLADIFTLIDQARFDQPVQDLAKQIFNTLAQAEAAVHGITPESVHFHEVGAADAILDICGAAFAAHHLPFKQVSASPTPVGTGTVTCDHGEMPIPVPAVAELFRSHAVPIRPDNTPMELVTPTGAAILVTLVERFGPSELTQIHRIGAGLGSRDIPGRANLLRILCQESPLPLSPSTTQRDRVIQMTTNLDDMNPEWYPPLVDKLFEAGALDVALFPITMKKGRPGCALELLAPPEQEERLATLLLENSTSLGVRILPMERITLARQKVTIQTPWGKITAKKAGNTLRLEHRDLLRIAQQNNWSLPVAYQNLTPYLTG
ncbi:MAG: nickel pincer cofactor biosynthesis protein LarC [Magnetococcales bacterium]|nr:nickel pincer cofactor biosynthesis protein LarC [Magnetococcales bacterium]